ncbi:MAG: Dyp-type peroxidase [Planctomycetaceae bacterium]
MSSAGSNSKKTLIASLAPGRESEPVLNVEQIQGNIFPGFSKDHQTLLFLRIDTPNLFSQWLRGFLNSVATTADVLDFNRLYKKLRGKLTGAEPDLRTTWANIAFSFQGLKKLERPGMNVDGFVDAAFKPGLLARAQSGELGDPVGSNTTGDPANWLVGGPGSEADVVLLLAADTRADLNNKVQEVVETLFPHLNEKGETVLCGASVLFRQDGDILPGGLAGHEHFGFKDGISQPGVRGLLPDGTPLTPNQNPNNPGQGKPGQDLLWPGEFVFGYPGQDPKKDIAEPGKDPLQNKDRKAPEFARNGSFLVFRRLRQNVGGFHQFLKQLGTQFGVSTELVGAKMVGRWPSGAPTVLSPTMDDPVLADDDQQNNNFEFAGEDDDPTGSKVPFAGHIRKTYPRDDESQSIPSLNEMTTQTHRLLRRGIPYGPPSRSSFSTPQHDEVDRGLLFMAYQVSIVDQFEFVTRNWANNPDFKDGGAGFDPIIGQNGDPSRRRSFRLGLPGEASPIETDQDWVIPTGGGYFFAPSIDALKSLAGVEDAKPRRNSEKPKKKSAKKTGRKK